MDTFGKRFHHASLSVSILDYVDKCDPGWFVPFVGENPWNNNNLHWGKAKTIISLARVAF